MTITIKNDDLIPLRRLLHSKYTELQAAPVMKSSGEQFKGVREGVKKDMAILAKAIRKINKALKKVEGHECNAGGNYSV